MLSPVDYAPSQVYGDNPTKYLPPDHWLILKFGNYQPDGHTGTDYPCPAGTPVRSVTAGRVLHAGYLTGTYADNPWWINPGFAGWVYVVDHGWFIGIYGHCMENAAQVRAGDWVDEGQILGPSGNTGASTGDHLHFEVLPDGYILNSYMYGRIDPSILLAAIPALNAINFQGEIVADGYTEADRAVAKEIKENLEKLVHLGVTHTGMLNNMAQWMNTDGKETKENVQKITLETVYGQEVQ